VDRLEQRVEQYENDRRAAQSLKQEATDQIAELHRKLPTEQGDPLS
jgi:hypothetical protein